MATTAYDEVRYSNHPYAQTHPDRLATVALLHGLDPPDPARARVLELGCGAGGNLLAMACATPGLRAVGIDLAAAPIAEGQAAAAELGLDGLELRQGDVRALRGGELGAFDYVIAHGVYAWVPPDARDALLAAIASHLAPRGIAYVSYNAYPGGYFRRLLRDAGLRHARAERDPLERAARAQQLYRFLLEHRASDDDVYGALLARELPAIAKGPLYRLVHDDLADHWDPVWFGDFADHAAAHGLDYVGEANPSRRLPPELAARVRELAGGDRVAFEQHVDLLTAAHFRESVLCRAGAPVEAEPRAEHMRGLHVAARPDREAESDGLVAAAYAELDARRPDALSFDELRAALDAEPAALAEALLEAFERELVMPHAGPLRAAAVIGERPEASPLARRQAARGDEQMTTLAYTVVEMRQPAARALLCLLDGTRDRAAIRADLAARAGVELGEDALEANLRALARLFLLYER